MPVTKQIISTFGSLLYFSNAP